MAAQSERGRRAGVDREKVSICVRELNHAIGELARGYGAACVVVALTEVMGCASCASDSVERSVRALVAPTSARPRRPCR